MTKTEITEINKLSLDLNNFRTIPQKNEVDAINAMISIKPDRFYAVMDSIIDDGYLPTENIIILEKGSDLIVKEGNRRIAALKLIHNQFNIDEFEIPDSIRTKIGLLDAAWKNDNNRVPCSIFDSTEVDTVDRIVKLAHGKGEKASRDPWTSVARARHNRDVNKASEPALDILEKYLKFGKNLTLQQKERWGGDYPLTVLEEALRKIFPRFNVKSTAELSINYPKIKFLSELEDILRDIGLDHLSFKIIREKTKDFGDTYGIPLIITPPASTPPLPKPTSTPSPVPPAPPAVAPTPPPPKAFSTNDPRHIAGLLKNFIPKGNNRHKVVTLRNEIQKLNLSTNPIAFCFLTRSMFEISAKLYCEDNSLNLVKANGRDKSLAELLKSITDHLTSNNSNLGMVKVLHGALTEIVRPEGILSVTSMNQLVHNPNFSIIPSDVCVLFGNIYPLLESMN